MTEIIKEGSGHRTHIKSPLMRESLMDRRVLAASDSEPVRAATYNRNSVPRMTTASAKPKRILWTACGNSVGRSNRYVRTGTPDSPNCNIRREL